MNLLDRADRACQPAVYILAFLLGLGLDEIAKWRVKRHIAKHYSR